MEKTFNLKSYIAKQANFAFEGSQGYFLAQSRAWMNCSKCQREKGKTAQEAWQTCFDEFQKGDRKLSWLESYAKDEVAGVPKEAAVDYAPEIVKMASEGVPMQEAVMGAIKTAQAKWWEKLRDKTVGGPGQKAVKEIDRKMIDTLGRPGVAPRQKRDLKIDGQTFDQLRYIVRLIKANEYDSHEIKQMIRGIPNEEARTTLSQYIKSIEQTEAEFTQQVYAMSAAAQKMIETYEQSQSFAAQPPVSVGAGFEPTPAATATTPEAPLVPPKAQPPSRMPPKAYPPSAS
jgi:hypothetical protein